MDHPAPFPRHGDTGKPVKRIAGGPAPDQEDVMVILLLCIHTDSPSLTFPLLA